MPQTCTDLNAEKELSTDPIEEPHQSSVIVSSIYFEQNKVKRFNTESYYDQHHFY